LDRFEIIWRFLQFKDNTSIDKCEGPHKLFKCNISSHSCQFKIPDPVYTSTAWMPARVAKCAVLPWVLRVGGIRIEEMKGVYQIIICIKKLSNMNVSKVGNCSCGSLVF
jgi:hypothetical protein